MVGGDANIELPREIDGTSVLFTGRQDQSEGQVSFTREVGCRSHATPISSSEARRPSPLIGIDHVGISSDFNHGGGVIGLMDADETLNVTAELLRRGYGDADVAKLGGATFMRVWQDVLDLGRSEGRT